MVHPCDGEAWQQFDKDFPDFASDPRNVRVAFATDGFTPFGLMAAPFDSVFCHHLVLNSLFYYFLLVQYYAISFLLIHLYTILLPPAYYKDVHMLYSNQFHYFLTKFAS